MDAMSTPPPRRLAVVSDAVSPWNTGGKERRHHELLTRLAAAGWVVEVYTMNWWGEPGSVTVDGIRYHAICRLRPLYSGQRRSITQALMFALACFKLVTRKFDVVEVDAIPFLPLLPMRVVTAVKRRPMVVTWHEYWGRTYWVRYLGSLGALAAVLENLCLRLPTRIIAASAATGARLDENCSYSLDIAVIPAGVTGVSETPPERPPVTPGARPSLICVGRLLSHKNVHRAIEAVDELRRRNTRVSLTVVGEGPERNALIALAKSLDLAEDVTFVPFLEDHADMLDLVASSDAMLFPSDREGFGMIALEAMSLGVPVITSNHPDNFARYLIDAGVSGEICSSDAESLADAAGRVLRARESMSQAARLVALDYDWDALAERAAVAYTL